MNLNKTLVLACVSSILAACGGGGSEGGSGAGGAPGSASSSSSSITPTFAVGGTVSGMTGTGLVLQNNGSNDLTVNANGAVTFTTPIASGSAYNITVKTQPTAKPAQTCAVTNGSGTVTSSVVTNVAIACRNLVGKFIYISNFADFSISAYSIDANTGALTSLGVTSTSGAGALAAFSVDSSEKFLYLTSGGGGVDASVFGFSINSQTGALSPLLHSPYSAGPTAIAALPIFAPSGKFLYLIKFSPNSSFGFSIDATSGELTALAATNPLPPFVYAAGFNPVNGKYYEVDNTQPSAVKLSVYGIDSSTGVASLTGFLTTGTTYGALVFDPSNKFLYLWPTGSNLSGISGFSVNATDGMLSPLPGPPLPVAPAGGSIVFHPSGKFVYYVGQTFPNVQTDTVLYAMSLDNSTGVIAPIGSGVVTGTGNAGIYMEPSGKFLLVRNSATPTLPALSSFSLFGINQVTGALTQVNSSTPLQSVTHASGVMWDPSGRFLYIIDATTKMITPFSFDPSNGTFSQGTALSTGSNPQPGRIVGLH